MKIADRTAAESELGRTWLQPEDWPDLEDGWVVHAAVGSFPANPFSLHEVIGNVWEWCLDGKNDDFYSRSPREDPVGPWTGNGAIYRSLRGGAFYDMASEARSARRVGGKAEALLSNIGVRPARAVSLSPSPPGPR